MCSYDGSELDAMGDDVERDVPEPDFFGVVWTGAQTGDDLYSSLIFKSRAEAEEFATQGDNDELLENGRVVPLAIIPF